MRIAEALACWERYRFTRALRAVDGGRVTAQARQAPDGPLRGLLFSVKDLFPVAGVESCAGSLLLAGSVPARDPALIAALRAAGAVVFGKGVCAEFGFGVDTENRLDGRVTHFAEPALSPGGSSGGDAVAVGAGMVDFAVAGDYGGSIRWPAQAAGVYGLRLGVAHPFAGAASSGRIGLRVPDGGPSDGCVPSLQAKLETAGLMARSPGVLHAVLGALGDRGPGDPGLGFGPLAVRNRRLMVTAGTEIAAVLPEVAAALAAAQAAGTRAGYDLVGAPAELGDALGEAFGVYAALRAATDDHVEVRALAAGREELLCGPTSAVLDQSPRTAIRSGAELSRLRERAVQIGAAVRAALRRSEADALLLPVAASGPIGFAARVAVAGRLLTATDLMAHCRAVSLTGLPALSVPGGAAAGRPSVQLVGADRAEALLCTVAADLAAGGFGPGAATRTAGGLGMRT